MMRFFDVLLLVMGLVCVCAGALMMIEAGRNLNLLGL